MTARRAVQARTVDQSQSIPNFHSCRLVLLEHLFGDFARLRVSVGLDHQSRLEIAVLVD
jgi:hypothetical protein